MQMSTDIRKPKVSHAVGIQRVRDSTTVSTTSSDMSRGGGGNDMDEEEALDSPDTGFPLDEDEDEDGQYGFHEDRQRELTEDDEFEDSDSDDENHRRTIRERLNRAWKWTKKFVMPTPSATAATLQNPQAALAGPQYTQRFKAPPGKRISSSRHL